MLPRVRTWIVIGVLAAVFLAALLLGRPAPSPPSPPLPSVPSPADAPPTAGEPGRTVTTVTTTTVIDCSGPSALAAAANGATADALVWTPFGSVERGWETYAPIVAREIGTRCAHDTPAFAAALSAWQGRNGFAPTGRFDVAVFARLKQAWNARRPYVAMRGRGVCPDPPRIEQLADARLDEGYRGKAVQARPAVLAAYRRMVAAARAEDPAIAADPQALTIFSAYRDPASDALRCLREGNCDGRRRARCSVHRTGLALDLTVGSAPGSTVDSTQDFNRLAQSRTPAYRWLVANAHRFGFVNYPYEPWHWEWTGEAP